LRNAVRQSRKGGKEGGRERDKQEGKKIVVLETTQKRETEKGNKKGTAPVVDRTQDLFMAYIIALEIQLDLLRVKRSTTELRGPADASVRFNAPEEPWSKPSSGYGIPVYTKAKTINMTNWNIHEYRHFGNLSSLQLLPGALWTIINNYNRMITLGIQ
jgi:hypothetical protein